MNSTITIAQKKQQIFEAFKAAKAKYLNNKTSANLIAMVKARCNCGLFSVML